MAIDLRKKAERFDTWYDRMRLLLAQGQTLQQAVATCSERCRLRALGEMCDAWFGRKTIADRTHALMLPSDWDLEKPPPLRSAESFLDPYVAQTPWRIDSGIEWPRSVFRVASEHRVELDEYYAEYRKSGRRNQRWDSLRSLMDSAGIQLGFETILKGRLFLLDSNLAEQVFRSKNDPIDGEDMTTLPFDQLVVEFSEPIGIKHESGTTEVPAVLFYRDAASGNFLVLWIATLHDQKIPFTPFGYAFVFGGLSAFPFWDDKLIGLPWSKELAIGIRVQSRNLWDFVTCRNIDYVVHERDTSRIKHVKKWRHVPSDTLPRTYRILAVNQQQVVYPNDGRLVSYEGPTANCREKVPGCFHKWVYCARCQEDGRRKGVHRHDLIGRPCRYCGVNVGPVANIKIQKWWHREHWRGPWQADEKEIVREVKKETHQVQRSGVEHDKH